MGWGEVAIKTTFIGAFVGDGGSLSRISFGATPATSPSVLESLQGKGTATTLLNTLFSSENTAEIMSLQAL